MPTFTIRIMKEAHLGRHACESPEILHSKFKTNGYENKVESPRNKIREFVCWHVAQKKGLKWTRHEPQPLG